MSARVLRRLVRSLRRIRGLELRVVDLEDRIRRAGRHDPPEADEVPLHGVQMLLERALEAHGVDLKDPVLSGLSAMENDLWTLHRSISDASAQDVRLVETLDRLAQRTALLVELARVR